MSFASFGMSFGVSFAIFGLSFCELRFVSNRYLFVSLNPVNFTSFGVSFVLSFASFGVSLGGGTLLFCL